MPEKKTVARRTTPAPKHPYRETTWHGIALYQCGQAGCFFDSFDEQEMQAHIARRHVPPEPREPVIVKIKDRYGNVVREEAV